MHNRDEYKDKRKELEKSTHPLMTCMYQEG